MTPAAVAETAQRTRPRAVIPFSTGRPAVIEIAFKAAPPRLGSDISPSRRRTPGAKLDVVSARANVTASSCPTVLEFTRTWATRRATGSEDILVRAEYQSDGSRGAMTTGQIAQAAN